MQRESESFDSGRQPFDPVRLEVYRHLFTALAEEMGAALRRSAYSPNIKERRDYSCAIFDARGRVVAMGDHMPVHLGALPLSIAAALGELGPLGAGDVAALNDPFRGGTHLPDITLIAPVYVPVSASTRRPASTPRSASAPRSVSTPQPASLPQPEATPRHAGGAQPASALSRPVGPGREGSGSQRTESMESDHADASGPGPRTDTTKGVSARTPLAYLAARAHHADVGGMAPGSMPLAREIFQEGLRIPPVRLMAGRRRNEDAWRLILANVRTPEEREGDLAAQLAALAAGRLRLLELVGRHGSAEVSVAMEALVAYAARLVQAGLKRIPDGVYEAEDAMDDDGLGSAPVIIRVRLEVAKGRVRVDFTGTAPQTAGGINAVAAITTSCVHYVVRCVVESLLGQQLPAGGGEMDAVELVLPPASVVAAAAPASVAGGNVETSQRITDVLFLAFSRALPDLIPAQSQGTMNNLTVGGLDPRTGASYAYYETVGGGMGAGPHAAGLSGVHVHMTNSLNTPVEALEHAYPFRVRRYSLRRETGGRGVHRGGDGLRRDLELLADAEVSLLTERRRSAPAGLAGGGAGARGENVLFRGHEETPLPAKTTFRARAGDVISVRTPGGGAWGAPSA